MLSVYLTEFLAVAAIHFLAVVAPGPDFAVTVRQSVAYGRRAGIITALGIGAGISVHVLYTLLGVGALLYSTPWLLNVAQLIGVFYLFYLGFIFIKKAGQQSLQMPFNIEGAGEKTVKQSFLLGFMTNATNPKATLFFLAVFTTLVSSTTPLGIQIFYGVWMCVVNATWFVLVALLFTRASVRERFLQMGPWFERVMGVLLILFSLRLCWAMVELVVFN